MKKNELRLRVRYEPPRVELFHLNNPLTIMGYFSRDAGFDDWEGEDGFAELEDEKNWGADDWTNLGAGNDTTW